MSTNAHIRMASRPPATLHTMGTLPCKVSDIVQALRPCTESSQCGKDFVCLRTSDMNMGLEDLTGGMVNVLKGMGVYTDQENADSCGGVRSGMSRLWNYIGDPLLGLCVH